MSEKHEENNKCNMKVLVSGTCESAAHFKLCGKQAIWRNQRWPTGIFCVAHKATLEKIVPDNWTPLGGR